MARNKLNVAKIRNRTAPGILGDGGGLWLRVAPCGKKYWTFRYRHKINTVIDGATGRVKVKAKEMGLGPFSEVDVTLDEVRELEAKYRRLLREGKDPMEYRRAEHQAKLVEAAKTKTFDDCAKEYIERHKSGWKNAKHAAQWETTLTRYVSPVFGKLPVRDIDKGLILDVFERKTDEYPKGIWEGIPVTASRLRTRIETILDWAADREYRTGDNPARWQGRLEHELPKPSTLTAPHTAKAKKHFAALHYDENGDFISKLRVQPGIAACAVEFAILTAARSGEVRGVSWEEIDFEACVWTIPAKRMKMKREHHIPLTPRALEILKSMAPKKSGLVFFGRGGKSLSDMSLTAVLRRMEVSFTVHGFRSTFRDWAEERTSFGGIVAEMALAHAIKDKTEAAYRRGDLLEKRRVLMEKWANFCNQPSAPQGEVLSIGEARA